MHRSYATKLMLAALFVPMMALAAHFWELRIERARAAAFDVEREARHLAIELERLKDETFNGQEHIKRLLGVLKEEARKVSAAADRLKDVIGRPHNGNWDEHYRLTRVEFIQLQGAYRGLSNSYQEFFHKIAEHEHGGGRHFEIHNIQETYAQLSTGMIKLETEMPHSIH